MAVLRRYLPAMLTSAEALQVSLQFFPHPSCEKTWAMRMAPALFGQTAEEKAALYARICADLAEI